MSIVDVIQRAKRMGLTPASFARSPATDVQASDTNVRPAVPVSQTVIEHPAFDVQSFDEATCADAHIIAQASDERLLKTASPPYRMLRARLLQRCRDNQWSTLAISSPGPGEGKSVTALNLAFTVAREGNYDVFLLDLDLRNPSICRYLGVTPKREISGYFQGSVTAQEVFFTLAGVDRLSIAGGTVGNSQASELLATNYLEKLLQFIKNSSTNPLILIDLPPIVNTDDTLVVAPRVDALILVVSEGVTRRDNLQQAVGLLAGFPVAGIALNRSSESMGSEYYGPLRLGLLQRQ